ncbi:hypothetical protein E2C01_059591 [Portunus trituberculatus]|uniref:Uncharacterized protein n=1 Tax=Portunus trituberculatus TaxID=210409 RepID=A0A5B7H872_PORTR|nr:hypothetical protein [Portunus trituberculatus]
MVPPPRLLYGDYDDNAKNLTAPLVVNTSPGMSKASYQFSFFTPIHHALLVMDGRKSSIL